MKVRPLKRKVYLKSSIINNSELNQKQIRKLEFLSEKIEFCNKCKRLRKNGMAIPYWSKKSKYLMLAEAPGFFEVQKENRTPLVGKAGKLCFEVLNDLGFNREDFLIINCVQCRPLNERGTNGKPFEEEINNCDFWFKKYLEVLNPSIILAFGGYALGKSLGHPSDIGITKMSGNLITLGLSSPMASYRYKVFACIHPASVLYSSENKRLFIESLKKFKEVVGK